MVLGKLAGHPRAAEQSVDLSGCQHEVELIGAVALLYVIKVYVARGVTTEHGIVATRRVERHVSRNSGDRISVLAVVERGRERDAIRLPETRTPSD